MRTILTLLLLCAAGAAGAGPTTQQWQEDLDFLDDQIRSEHRDPFAHVEKSEFDAAVRNLRLRIPDLDEHRIVAGFMAIAAMLGDGHTRLTVPLRFPDLSAIHRGHSKTEPPADPSLNMNQYPLRLYWFEDGLFVTATDRAHENLLGMRLTGIGELPVDEAVAAIRPIVRADNEQDFRFNAAGHLTIPELLAARDITGDPSRAHFRFIDSDGGELEVLLEPVDELSEWTDLTLAETAPVTLRRRHEYYWYQALPEHDALLVQVNRIEDSPRQSIIAFAAEVEDLIATGEFDRVVLDLRFNRGGNGSYNRALLLPLLRQPVTRRFGHLYTLIGPGTFSAAMKLTSSLESLSSTLFAGVPTGSRPSHFGDSRKTRLPNSGLTLRVSTVYWRDWTTFENREQIDPDLPAPMTSAVLRGGADPAMETVLGFEPAEPLTGLMSQLMQRSNINSAAVMYYRYRTDPANRAWDTREMLIAFGEELLAQERWNHARAAFMLTLLDFPDSARAHAGLGNAWSALDEPEDADNNWRTACELDPDVPGVPRGYCD